MSFDFLQNKLVRIALVCGGAIFLLSALISLVAGAGVWSILGRALFFGVLMGGLCAGLYEVLHKMVPEIVELFDSTSASRESDETLFSSESGDISDFEEGELSSESLGGDYTPEEIRIDEDEIARKKQPKKKAAKPGDIIAEGVALENNPELMAEAVKHVLDTDKDAT